MRTGVIILLGAALLSSGLPVSALAAEDPEALITEGVKLRRQGQDARAEGYFKRAYQLARTPRTAAQLGLVELAVGEFYDAELRLSEALAARDAWVSEHRKALENGRAMGRQHLLRVELAPVPSGATYAIGGGGAVGVPPDGVLWLAPGTSSLQIAVPGRPALEVRAEGGEGEVRKIALELAAREEPFKPVKVAAPAGRQPVPPQAVPVIVPPAPVATQPVQPVAPEIDADDGRGLRIAGIGLATAGVAAEIVGAILYMQGSSRLEEYRNAVNSNGQIPWNPRDESWKTLRQGAVACFAGGAAAIAGGAALFIAGSGRGDRSAEARVSFVAGPGLGIASFRGAF